MTGARKVSMAKHILPALCIFLAYPSPAKSAAPAWDADPYLGLSSGSVIAYSASFGFSPDARIAKAGAYARAMKGICGVLSHQYVSSLRKDFGRYNKHTEELATGTMADFSGCPLSSGMFKDYLADNESVLVSAFKTRRFDDENLRILVEEHEDRDGKAYYIRAVIPLSGQAYLEFTKQYGASEVEILGSLLTGKEAPAAGRPPASLTAEFRTLRDNFVKDTDALEKELGGKFKVWKGGNIKVYMQQLQSGGKTESELLLEDSDAKTTWVEHMPTGVLMRDGTETNFIYSRPAGGWLPLEK